MGAHILAIVVWLGSLSLYGAAFFFPEVHRRHDFLVSGLGAFYGLVLWFSAVQTSSTELLGQVASVGLLGWFGWQTLSLRRKRTPLELQTPLTADSWPAFGRQLKQSVFSWLRGTPLGRWLPAQGERGRGVEPYATGGIRVSSLKDVDYEFVDELASQPRPSPARVALAPAPKSPATAAPAPVSQAAVRPAPSPRPKPPSPPLPRPPWPNRQPPAGARDGGGSRPGWEI
ncbi:MAG TPA: Ycf66 family protein [Nodosilinea sp.]|nr:Ycf66 family protein [Nodosilinea sp.]